MSEENVEIVKEFSQRFAEGAADLGRNYFHPEIIWGTSASGLPSAGVYHGRQEVSKFFREWLGPWRDYEIEYREYFDAWPRRLRRPPGRAMNCERGVTVRGEE